MTTVTPAGQTGPIERALTALRYPPGRAPALAGLPPPDADAVAVAALVLGLGPLLAWELARQGVTLPARAPALRRGGPAGAAARAAAIAAQLDELLAACAARGITPLVLKGAHLAAAVYPEPGLRPMNDLDLLFRHDDLLAAEQALLALGYACKEKSPELGAGVVKHTKTFRRPGEHGATPSPYLSTDAGRMVEPHVSLEEAWFGLRCDITPGVWERSHLAEWWGGRARVLAPEDLALHLGVHVSFHLIMGHPSLVQLADLRWTAERLGPALDWDALARRAAERRAGAFVYAAVGLAVRLLGAPVPEAACTALRAACPPALRARAESLALAHVLARTQRPPLTTLPQRIARGFADRAETARWAPSLAGKWAVWRTALAVWRTDTGRMLVTGSGEE
jgi:hypothetical protein